MTDTARAILKYKGVIYKNHLLNGVKKGALTEADVEKKFEAWLSEKEGKVTSKKDALSSAAEKEKAARLAAEKEVNEKRAQELAAQNAPVEEAPVAEETTEAPAEEAASEETSEDKAE